MSTLRVSSINNAAASAGGIAIDSSGGVSGALPAPNRNLLYNGAMQLSQRGTSTTGITAGGYYTADRWNLIAAGTSIGTLTQSIENDAPTGSGFRRSVRLLWTTARSSPAAGDLAIFRQILEGQDVQRVRKGTSSAQRLTLSFWVKSNVTGTYVARLNDNDNSRHVAATYTISASATWERKTITFPADTTGAFDNDNADSLRVDFGLLAGSTYTSGTLPTTWQSVVNADVLVGQVNVAAATNNYWQVTGVQLEVGDAATDFEFKSFGQELRECQRYYYLHASGDSAHIGAANAYSASQVIVSVHFPTSMRVAPNLSIASGTDYYSFLRNGASDGFNDATIATATQSSCYITNSTNISSTAGHGGTSRTNNAAASIAFSSEL